MTKKQEDLIPPVPGIRYRPPNKEMFNFLELEDSGNSFPAGPLLEQTLIYSHDPQEIIEICSQMPAVSEAAKSVWYFGTYNNPIDENFQFPYHTPNGYWVPTGPCEAFPPIGFKRLLEFCEGNQPRGAKTGWIIHEYHVLPNTELNDSDDRVWIFSKIIHNKGKAE